MNDAKRLSARTVWVPATAALINGAALQAFPGLESGVFVRVSAWLAGILTASPVEATTAGWVFQFHGLPMLVSAACSATDYWLIVTALLAWQFGRGQTGAARAILAACLLSAPVAIAVNVARLTSLAVAHRWLIPLAPEAYANVLHLMLGIAVFLPALIALNALLEHRHARPQSDALR